MPAASVSIEERVEAVRELRAQGLKYGEVAERLGISLHYARHLGSSVSVEEQRRMSRDAKRKRTGVCSRCGAETRYHGHGRGVSDRCHGCASREVGLAARGSGEIPGKALAFLAVPRRFVELREHLGISDGYVSQLLYGRLLPYGLVRRVKRGWYVAVDGQDGATHGD